MTTAIATTPNGNSQLAATAQTDLDPTLWEKVMVGGDLSALTPQERVKYYLGVCKSLGVNPLTKPFDYIWLKGEDGAKKLTLYPTKGATDQVGARAGVSFPEYAEDWKGDLYIYRVRGVTPAGRALWASAVVSLKGVQDWKVPDLLMKAESKARRRCVLALVGLGWPDATEVADMVTQGTAIPARVDTDTGEIIEGQAVEVTGTYGRSNGNGHTDAPALPTLTDLQARWLGLVEQADELGIVLKSRELDTTRPLDSLARTVHALALKVAEVQAALEAERPGAEVEEEKFPF